MPPGGQNSDAADKGSRDRHFGGRLGDPPGGDSEPVEGTQLGRAEAAHYTSVIYSPAEQQYLRNLHALGVTNTSDSELASTGHMVCYDIDNGAELESEVSRLRMQGWPTVSAARVVARAVLDLCPPNRR